MRYMLALLLGITIYLTTLVSAGPVFDSIGYGLEQGLNTFARVTAPFFESIIGEYSGSEFFFSKVLLLILLVLLIGKILEVMPLFSTNRKIAWIVAILLSIIGIRFVKQNSFFEAIFIQYGVLTVALTTILPMIIFFYFIHKVKIGRLGRRIFWAIYAATLIGIWISKAGKLPAAANWMYIIAFIATLAFIIWDAAIHAYFELSGYRKFKQSNVKENIRHLKRELYELREDRRRDIITKEEFDKESKEIEDRIKELTKED